METLGERIKHSRKSCGFTIEQLAEALNMSPSTIGNIENGSYYPSLQELLPIIEILQESPSYIICNIRSPRIQGLYNKFEKKLEGLTRSQLKTVEDILDAYIKNL